MIEADVAAELRALAARVRRLMPLNHEPERFFEDKDEVAHDLNALAERMAPSSGRRQAKQEGRGGAPSIRGRVVVTSTVINGKRLTVQRLRPAFSIHVGK